MSLFERDYIKRLIQQLARFVALIGRARDERKLDVALRLSEDAHREVLGVPHEMLSRLDVRSAALLLGPGKIALYAELLRLEADLRRELGQIEDGDAAEHRAVALERQIDG